MLLIGFREFNDYLSSEEPSTAQFRDAVERMKLSTRQYAKRQISWIRNKLLPAIRIANSQTPNCVPMYLLDATSKFLYLLNFQHHHLCRTWRTLVFECQEPSVRNNGRYVIDITNLTVALISPDFLGERTPQDPLTMSTLASKLLNAGTTTQ